LVFVAFSATGLFRNDIAADAAPLAKWRPHEIPLTNLPDSDAI